MPSWLRSFDSRRKTAAACGSENAALGKIRSQKSLRDLDFPHFNEQIRPFGILNVDCDGNYSTYSPELLGMNVSPYGTFSFGNILKDEKNEF
jgi:hypothetical protein